MADGRSQRESILSTTVRAHISHAVIATYAADAALEVAGVYGLLGGHFGSLTRRTEPERAVKAVRVAATADGGIALELHVVVNWDARVPEVVAHLDAHLRDYLRSMIDLELVSIDVFVDGLATPDGRAIAA